MNLKGSIIPAKLGQIKEEGENDEENDNFELGGDYIEPDEEKDDDKIQKEKMKKEQEKKFKQSRLKFSINSNVFDFADKNDENYLNDLKNEINGLYKLRDNLNDQITKDELKYLLGQFCNEINNNLNNSTTFSQNIQDQSISKPHSSVKGNQNALAPIVALKTFKPEIIETCYKVVLKGGVVWDVCSTYNCRDPAKEPVEGYCNTY